MRHRASQGAPVTTDSRDADGRLRAAVDALTDANRASRDPETERQLVHLRHELGVKLDSAAQPGPWPVFEPADPLPTNAFRLPSVPPDELTPEALTTGIRRQGCVHVRRLLPESMVTHLIEAIDRSFEAF